MEQRSLRLGDIVDDYCPRERRLTNHAVVAIVEDAIRQTRCTTCDYEHVYKQAREPRRRKQSDGSLFDQVLTEVAGPPRSAARVVPPATPAPAVVETAVPTVDATIAVDAPPPGPAPDEAWPAHRTLIRASLPKTASEPPPRPIPEFTMHQKPQPARVRHARVVYGPQGDPFGRPTQGGPPPGRGHGNGQNGQAAPGQGQAPGKRRGRRRRGGKRSH